MPYKIILDAGHGGDDPGAIFQGRQEKDDTLKLTLAVGRILADNGIDVVYTRTTDIYQTPFQKATIGNESGADYFISFHRNSSPQANQYSGVETLVYSKGGIATEMAENINGALAELGFPNLGVKERPGLVVLRRTQMPALLIEAGFLNTAEDNNLFDQRFEDIAVAIAYAILGTLDEATVNSAEQSMQPAQPDPDPVVWSTPNETLAGHTTPMPRASGPERADRPNRPARPDRPDRPNRPNRPTGPQPEPVPTPETYYRVQVGAYKNKEYADQLVYELDDQGFPAFLLYEDGFYKVQVGAFLNLGNAIRMEQRLRQTGYSTWITT